VGVVEVGATEAEGLVDVADVEITVVAEADSVESVDGE
jgi:hypothetical protein